MSQLSRLPVLVDKPQVLPLIGHLLTLLILLTSSHEPTIWVKAPILRSCSQWSSSLCSSEQNLFQKCEPRSLEIGKENFADERKYWPAPDVGLVKGSEICEELTNLLSAKSVSTNRSEAFGEETVKTQQISGIRNYRRNVIENLKKM